MRHPFQRTYFDNQGIQRFQKNDIVEFLLEAGPYDLNALALRPWNDEDRAQFAQLLGYSLSGFLDLSYVGEETCTEVEKMIAEKEEA